MENAVASLRNDINNTRGFNYDTENYVANMKKKREERIFMFDEYGENSFFGDYFQTEEAIYKRSLL